MQITTDIVQSSKCKSVPVALRMPTAYRSWMRLGRGRGEEVGKALGGSGCGAGGQRRRGRRGGGERGSGGR